MAKKPAEKQKTLNDLFLDQLKDTLHAEKQILRALPRMARNADSEELKQVLQAHRDETQGQIERLEQIFEALGKRAQAKPCEAMAGIIEESKEHMEEYDGSPALDAAILSSAQAIEHYEITRYGTLRTWAQRLGMDDAVKLLEETLAEEKRTDERLTEVAETAVNAEAQEAAE